MHLIIGLGNPGSKYQYTRHNAGFMVLEALAQKHGFNAPTNFGQSLVSKGQIEGAKVVLAWPQCYMNLSGRAARELVNFYKTPATEILVIHDEMDLLPGQIKLLKGGGTAGHNGLVSLWENLPDGFDRLKIGIGRPPKEIPIPKADYVLSPFHPVEHPLVLDAITEAEEAARLWLTGGLVKAQNIINKKLKKKEKEAKAQVAKEAENC